MTSAQPWLGPKMRRLGRSLLVGSALYIWAERSWWMVAVCGIVAAAYAVLAVFSPAMASDWAPGRAWLRWRERRLALKVAAMERRLTTLEVR